MVYRMKKLIIIIFFIMIFTKEAFGEDYIDISDFDFSEIENVMNENEFDFTECLEEIIGGNIKGGINKSWDMLVNALFGELQAEKYVMVKIIVIGLIAALFTNITGGILSGRVSETGFYITYMSLIVSIMTGYTVIANLVKGTIGKLIQLMEAITPVYIISIGFSTGESSASAFYQVFVIVITLIERVLLDFIIPAIYMYMILNVINNLMDGKMFSKACELIKLVIEWALKTTMTLVIGLNLVRTLINPIVDSIKAGSMWKVMQSIPGVGNAFNSVSSIIFASGTLIKNGIGLTSMIAILVVCFLPICKTGIISISYKALGALLEPISDKRVINCINGAHESLVLLMKTLIYSTIFFILTIAIICASTNYRVN